MCSVHVKQYQDTPGPDHRYSFEARVTDANRFYMGHLSKTVASYAVMVKTKSFDMVITTKYVDSDPIAFQFRDDSWDTTSPGRCTVGQYDSGARDMDCWFNF